MADFLLELLSEEIPARMQARARNELARMFAECTGEAGLTTGAIDVHSTPRRLVLIAREVAAQTKASREELKGPRASAPPQALDGFLRKTGLTREQLEERDGVWFAVIERPGRDAVVVIGDVVRRILADFPWPKSMRWGAGTMRWVRPLQGIVAILGEELIPITVEGVESSATTTGHRFHHPGPITVGGAHDYLEKLRACHVIVDQDERERLIREGAEAAARNAGLTLLADEGLVVENAGLTEWPVPLLGRFDPDFLDVPREVIVLTMRTNQKYFACTGEDGALAPAFVCVANVDATDGGESIVEGNKRVLAARLSDARFFWEQDLKVPLEEQAKRLAGIVFHEKLGTVADKVERVAKLARWLVEEGIVTSPLPLAGGAGGGPIGAQATHDMPTPNPSREREGDLAAQAERAARLAKADLVTGMVGEFPELQGVIGGYLARAQGEPGAVADAVRDHYKPVGQGDQVPTAPVAVAVSYAERLDTLVGFFANGLTPTGSSDPYALRRTLLGLLRIILENKIRVDLAEEYSETIGEFFGPLPDPSRPKPDIPFLNVEGLERDPNVKAVISGDQTKIVRGEELLASVVGRFDSVASMRVRSEKVWAGYGKLMDFTQERFKVLLASSGVRHDITAASAALPDERLPEFDIVRLFARAQALRSLVETPTGKDLLTAYKRAANILKKEEGTWTANQVRGDDVQAGERALVAALDDAEPRASAAIEAEDFGVAMSALASLRQPIDAFFDHVTVNVDDPGTRARRLSLLARFRDAVNRVADFSKIEG